MNSGIVINKSDFTINGNGHSIDGSNQARIFDIIGNNITISNLIFINGYSNANGGAILSNGNLNLINCVFENNTAKNGGAAYFKNGIENSLINSTFNGNHATRAGGAISVMGPASNNTITSEFNNNTAKEASGGGIFFYKTAENNIIESIFTNNNAAYGAGMFFYSESNSNTFKGDFINNIARSCGGALFFYSKTNYNIFKGNYINNKAYGLIDEINGNGGAITFKNTSKNNVLECDFINNTARLYGGAVNYRMTPYNITFKGNFIANSALSGGGLNFFDEFDNVSLSCNFIANNATKGGAIAINKEKNNASIIYSEIQTIANCNFTANNATRGGAIYFGTNGLVKDCNFEYNHAEEWGGAIFSLELYCENSNFKGNNASIAGGAVMNVGGLYTSINDTFIDNNANTGGAIESDYGKLVIINGTFSSKDIQNRGLVYMANTLMHIENTTFANTMSKYAPAIYSTQSNGKIKKSTFVNLSATITAGAMGIREHTGEITIDDCDFINTQSEKNGGAIYADVGGEHGIADGNITILNSRFTNCISEFGGAYLQLAGHLTIDNTNFTSNTANFDGGAVYTSWVRNVNISNSIFTSNMGLYNGYSNGGAVYFDMGEVILKSCIFEDNNASNGSSIYTYDCDLSLLNNYFNNPTENGTSICGVYCGYHGSGNNFTDDIVSLNNTNYDMTVESSQTHFDLINNTINVQTLPKRFDLRDWGWVSSVKNQGKMGSCWAFGITAALESVLIRYANITYDFSENSLQNTMLRYSKYGNTPLAESGNTVFGQSYYSSWLGVSPAEYDTYDELGKISPLIATPEDVQIRDIVLIPTRKNLTDNDQLKWALLNYGAIAIGYNHDSETYYNETTYGYYNYASPDMNHIVCLVGWDDNYPKENFVETPPGDGAFILKNSWGTGFGEEGYFYISYYDVSIAIDIPSMTFDIKNNNNYDKLYQHETDYNDILNYTYAMNKFVAQENLMIAAVGSFINQVDSYDYSILVNGEKVYEQNGTFDYIGYATVELDECIPVMKGDEFAVISKSTQQNSGTIRTHAEPHVSFASNDGIEWKDLTEDNISAIIKVYTINLDIYTQDLVKIYKNDSKFEANIGIVNETVIFEINGRNYTRVSDENGTASMAINLGPGNYTIKTTFNGTTVENTIEVLPTLYAENLVKYFRNASQFYIDFIDGEGNPVNGTNITMNINGVFYNRTTNENGTARLNINLIPGEYILTAIDPLTGLMMSYNITVLPTLNATDLEMTYKDGSKFNVTVLDGEGNPLADAKVTFNINGVFYNRYTDSAGIAMLNITLMAGEYIITSEYDGFKISNTITIKD